MTSHLVCTDGRPLSTLWRNWGDVCVCTLQYQVTYRGTHRYTGWRSIGRWAAGSRSNCEDPCKMISIRSPPPHLLMCAWQQLFWYNNNKRISLSFLLLLLCVNATDCISTKFTNSIFLYDEVHCCPRYIERKREREGSSNVTSDLMDDDSLVVPFRVLGGGLDGFNR